jgi:hypothetical protein
MSMAIWSSNRPRSLFSEVSRCYSNLKFSCKFQIKAFCRLSSEDTLRVSKGRVNILGFPRSELCRDRTKQQTPLGQKAGVSIRDTEWKYLNIALLRYARKQSIKFSVANCNKRQDQYIYCICCDWRLSILTSEVASNLCL